MGLINGLVIEDKQLDVGISEFVNFRLSLSNRAGVVLAADRYDLYKFFRIVEIIHFLNSLAIDAFLMPSWQQNTKRQAWVEIDRRCMIQPCMLWFFPDKEAQANIEDGLYRHKQYNQKVEYMQRCAENGSRHDVCSP